MLSSTRRRFGNIEYDCEMLNKNYFELRSMVEKLAEAMGCKIEWRTCERDGYKVIKNRDSQDNERR